MSGLRVGAGRFGGRRAVPPPDEGLPEHVSQTAASIANLHVRAEAAVGKHQRSVEWLSARLGRPSSLYAIFALVVAWATWNAVGHAHGQAVIDPPPFVWLQGILSLSSLLMTTIVLTTQNRQTRHAEQRSRLDLQVNLLSEAKIAKLIALLEELRQDMPSVPNRVDLLADAMTKTVDPTAVLSALEEEIESKRDDSDPL